MKRGSQLYRRKKEAAVNIFFGMVKFNLFINFTNYIVVLFKDVLKKPAEEFGNDSMLEELWAKKAFEHAELHFNLLISLDPVNLRLTPYDDHIYKAFRDEFPDLRVDEINEDELKGDLSKKKWRQFIQKFDKIEDFSFGTLLRPKSHEEFSPENSILVVRIQFLAIEVARNKEGCNNSLRDKFAKKYAAIAQQEIAENV